MNKYCKVLLRSAVAATKFMLIKLKSGKNFSYSIISLVSPFTEITVEKGAQLFLGARFSMHSGSKIYVKKGAKLSIGDHFFMNSNCVINTWEDVKIGNDVQFGPGVLVFDQDHDVRVLGGLAAEKYKTKPIIIGNGVWIGADSIILRGTVIGDNSVIGAGSVVKGIVAPNTMLVQKRENITREIQK